MSNNHHSNRNFIMTLSWRKDNWAILLSLIFFGISFIGLVKHEMWRDELQAWLIARDSSSIINLFENLRYEGHPGLWHLGLYVITRFTGNPFWMQIYHLILATATIYVLTRFSPFTRLQKILFAFGYFPFYEYSVISRNYGIGILCIFVFCALFTRPSRNYIIFSVILALMANTNIYGTMFAISIGVTLLWEIILDGNINRILVDKKNEIGIGIIIFFTGIGGAILQMLPPPDRWHGVDWKTDLDLERLIETANIILKGYLLVLGYTPLSTNGLFTFLIGCLLIAISVILIYHDKKVLFLYLFGTGFIMLFAYTKYPGALRHHGYLFMLLISCLWISSQQQKISNILVNKNRAINKFIYLVKRHKIRLITILLCLHVAVGVPFFIRDLIYPFSASKATANYIAQEQPIEELIIVGYPIQKLAPIAGLLNTKIYYPQQNSFGSFTVWKKDNLIGMTTREILEYVRELHQNYNQSILLITDYPLENDEILAIQTSLSISKEAEFTKSMENERYYLYRVKP